MKIIYMNKKTDNSFLHKMKIKKLDTDLRIKTKNLLLN